MTEGISGRRPNGTGRLDTSLESSGAEFLALGNLLVEGIQAFKAYTNFPGYDLVATNAEKNLSCRAQVKSRFATDFDGGFVVFVALNKGYRYRRKKHGDRRTRGAKSFSGIWTTRRGMCRGGISSVRIWNSADELAGRGPA